MVRRIMVVAPHPDDETLGCGGTLLRHKAKGEVIHWLIVTSLRQDEGFSAERIRNRQSEIVQVAKKYGFSSINQLELPTTKLDCLPMHLLVETIGNVLEQIKPETLYLPYRGDVHTDHAVVFDAVAACTKWFRYPFINKVLVYETLSETDFGLNPDTNGFQPNVFVNIEPYLEEKIKIMSIYSSEVGSFPFPRSEETIRALAKVRGAASGFRAAEAFMLLRERCD